VLTIGRQVSSKPNLPVLDIAYRSRQLEFRRKQIAQWLENEHEILKLEVESVAADSRDDFLRERIALIESEAVRQEKDALATFGMLAGHDDRVAPVRRALAVWGLTPDDIGVVSIHGTSTQANEKNETSVYNDVFTNIGRTPGNAVPVIAQKNLTGAYPQFIELGAVTLKDPPRPS
jgi:fatty acid synthase subunit alpha